MTEQTDSDVVVETLAALRRESDYGRSLDLIGGAWPRLAPVRGRALRGLIEDIPEREWRHLPWIVAAVGASYHAIDSPGRAAALPWFDAAERLIAATDDAPVSVVAGVQIHYAAVLRSLGRLSAARHRSAAARAALATDVGLPSALRVRLQASAELQLGLIALHIGEFDDARRHLHLAVGIGGATLMPTDVAECLSGLAYLAYTAGEFARASAYCADVRAVVLANSLPLGWFTAAALATETLIAVEQNRLADALSLAPTLRTAGLGSEWEALARNALGSTAAISGRLAEGVDELGTAIGATVGWEPAPIIRSTCEGMSAVLLIHLGREDEATRIFERLTPNHDHALCPARFVAGIRFAAGDVKGTLDSLHDCTALGERHSRRTLVDVLLLRAAANYELGNDRVADIALDRALRTAAVNGLCRPFAVVPRPHLLAMLDRATTRRQPDAVRTIIEHQRRMPGGTPTETTDSLSAREREIARRLLPDATVGQIAADLYVSTNTVKTQLRSIYRKVGATSREQAVTRLRELGLN